MSVILLTFYIFFCHLAFCAVFLKLSPRIILLSAITLSLGQIVLSQTLLGILGALFPVYLLTLNLAVSTSLLALVLRHPLRTWFKHQPKDRSCVGWENWALIFLLVFASAWLYHAVLFFPPRSADDLTYHLPVVYEYFQNHRIFLLPLDIRHHFAFPQNAELYFLWPVMLLQSTTWVDIVQWIFALLGIPVIYALGREFHLTRRHALFASLLFPLTPLVLVQAGSNYIDIITSVSFLYCLYFATVYYRNQDSRLLYILGVTVGLTWGMKYSLMIPLLFLHLFLLPKAIKTDKLVLLKYIVIVVIFGGYWYGRNWIELGNPFYPTDFFKNGLGLFTEVAPQASFAESLVRKFNLLFFKDVGSGTVHGGLGLVFLTLALPSWIIIFGRSLKQWRDSEGKLALFIWGQVLLGIGLVFCVSLPEFHVGGPRYSIFMIAIAFLALSRILMEATGKTIVFGVRLLTILLSTLGISVLERASMPTYRLTDAVYQSEKHKPLSEFSYLRHAIWTMKTMAIYAEPLDILTKNAGLTCYLAASTAAYMPAAVYGSQLQNRWWNAHQDLSPDVFIFHKFKNHDFMLNQYQFTLEDVASDPENIMIVQENGVTMFMRKGAFNGERKARLLRWQTAKQGVSTDR